MQVEFDEKEPEVEDQIVDQVSQDEMNKDFSYIKSFQLRQKIENENKRKGRGRPPVHGLYRGQKQKYLRYDQENIIPGITLKVRGTQPGQKRGPYKKRNPVITKEMYEQETNRFEDVDDIKGLLSEEEDLK